MDPEAFRTLLLDWFDESARDLPWRRDRDPYRVWISEVMLQQTRVAAVIPYYERFLERFPSLDSLASAPELELLQAWAGLGYYSRARNLRKAAIATGGSFPADYGSIRALPGIGDYTGAAVASIAYGLPYAAVDGNVLRVISRVMADPADIRTPQTRERFRAVAQALLDPARPGDFNQAMMELGATVCLPGNPQCLVCPVSALCEARRQGRQNEFPVKLRRGRANRVERVLLIVRRGDALLFWQRPASGKRLAGFWELPDTSQLPEAELGAELGMFRHSITNTNYSFTVMEARIGTNPEGFSWLSTNPPLEYLFSTSTRKALRFALRV